MNAEDRVRDVLLKAAKKLEAAWHAAYQGQSGDDWHVATRQELDRAVLEARRLMKEHAQELGSTAGLFEKTRISKLYQDLDNAVHRVSMARANPSGLDEPETGQELAQSIVDSLRQQVSAAHRKVDPRRLDSDALEASLGKLLAWARQQCEQALQKIRDLGLGEEPHFCALVGDVRSSIEHLVQREIDDKRAGWFEPATYTKITAADLEGVARSRSMTYECYANGQVREVVFRVNGAVDSTLKLALGEASARYEDSANWAEFLPDGMVEEYGGRYERVVLARMTFRQWVLGVLAREMSI